MGQLYPLPGDLKKVLPFDKASKKDFLSIT